MKLIINADDFGLTKSITDGIVEAIKAGAVTSTTLMANTQWTDYAIKHAIDNELDCIGLHAVFTFGKPFTKCPSLCDANGNFLKRDAQFANKKINETEAYNEVMAQFNYIKNKGIKITHIDSHHFSGGLPVLSKVITRIAKEQNLPVRRDFFNSDVRTTDIFCTDFFGHTNESISPDSLKTILNKYKDLDKTIELMCHVGYIDDYTRGITSYQAREIELSTLLNAAKNGAFNGIDLISFNALKMK